MRKSIPYSAALLLGILNPPPVAAITADKTCTIEASGEACIFDLRATANGTLQVCTTAARSGNRWRATLAQVNTAGAISKVGSGSTTTCTGVVQRNVVSGNNYEVLVTYERPLPGTFPTSVKARIVGPFASIPNPRPISFVEGQSCKQIREAAVAAAAVDVESMTCGSLMMCRLDPAGDTDTFSFMAPAGGAVSIKIAGPTWSRWDLFGPTGEALGASFGQATTGPLPLSGKHTIGVTNTANNVGDYVLSLQGISQSFHCASSMAFGDLKTGRLDQQGDTDTFSFVAIQGQVVNIKITGPTWSRWDLFGPAGQSLGASFGQATTAALPADGSYIIHVTNTANNTGNYTLSLQKVGGPD